MVFRFRPWLRNLKITVYDVLAFKANRENSLNAMCDEAVTG